MARETYTVKLTEDEAAELRGLIEPGRLKKRTRIARENTDYAAFARRAITAFGRRAGADVDALPELHALVDVAQGQLVAAVDACRIEGYSWAEIAQRLGMTRQGAQQWFNRASGSARIQRQQVVDGQMTIEEAE